MRLPGTELDVSPLSFGTGDLGTGIVGDDANRLLDAYVERGGDFIDTAHCYAAWVPGHNGASERAVGAWLRHSGARRRVVISTKGGHPSIGEEYPRPGDFLAPEVLAQDVAESLERMGIDAIDLYYLHRDDGKTPVGEIVDALNDLPALRYLGVSNWSVERLAEANAYAARTGKKGFVALQDQWSLAIPAWRMTADPTVRYVADEERDWCAANGVAIHAYSSTANGYFGKEADDGPFAGNVALREKARAVAARFGRTANQVALAWLFAQPGTVVPIMSTGKLPHLEDAFAALTLKLDPEAIAELDAARVR